MTTPPPDVTVEVEPAPLVLEWTGPEARAIRQWAWELGIPEKELLARALRAWRTARTVARGADAVLGILQRLNRVLPGAPP